MNQQIAAGVDWGSSSFRAYRFDEHGAVVETHAAAIGIKYVAADQFESVLFEQIGSWLSPGDRVLLSGMITSRQGWIESPYLPCPVDIEQLQVGAVEHHCRGISLLFLPGVSQLEPCSDVMRGEELQLLGALAELDGSLIVMPGTHSKWVLFEGHRLLQFRTVVTGELYELLLAHALVGALAATGEWDQDAFLAGVVKGYTSNAIISELFQCRSGVLLQTMRASQVGAFLSGLLIGNEIKEGTAQMPPKKGHAIGLIGSHQHCARYDMAFQCCGFAVKIVSPDAAIEGYKRLNQSS